MPRSLGAGGAASPGPLGLQSSAEALEQGRRWPSGRALPSRALGARGQAPLNSGAPPGHLFPPHSEPEGAWASGSCTLQAGGGGSHAGCFRRGPQSTVTVGGGAPGCTPGNGTRRPDWQCHPLNPVRWQDFEPDAPIPSSRGTGPPSPSDPVPAWRTARFGPPGVDADAKPECHGLRPSRET